MKRIRPFRCGGRFFEKYGGGPDTIECGSVRWDIARTTHGIEGGNDVTDKWKLAPEKLRKLKDPKSWKIEGTDEWSSGRKGVGLIGQDRAVESISFGLMVPGRGYNIFVTGQPEIGRAHV